MKSHNNAQDKERTGHEGPGRGHRIEENSPAELQRLSAFHPAPLRRFRRRADGPDRHDDGPCDAGRPAVQPAGLRHPQLQTHSGCGLRRRPLHAHSAAAGRSRARSSPASICRSGMLKRASRRLPREPRQPCGRGHHPAALSRRLFRRHRVRLGAGASARSAPGPARTGPRPAAEDRQDAAHGHGRHTHRLRCAAGCGIAEPTTASS